MARRGLATPQQSPPPPVAVPKLPRLPAKRRPGLLLFGAAVVISGGVMAAYTVGALSDRVPVIVVARPVPIGQQITKADVTTALVDADNSVATINASQLTHLIGWRAAVDLKPGTLVHRQLITDRMTPLPGQELVPVALKQSRLPARSLKSGDLVRVVPASDSESADGESASPLKITAVVDRVRGPDNDGLVVVDLLVNTQTGTDNSDILAKEAADGQVALILSPRRP